MTASQHFIAKDYPRAFELKKLFHKYVVYFSQLNYADSKEPLSSKERHELTFKLQETTNEMSLLVLKMKELKSDSEALNNATPLASMKLSTINEYLAAN